MSRELIVEEHTFPLDGASTAEVELDMTSGEVRVAGGARELAEAVFRYSHPELKPEVEYEVDGDEAELEISQPHVEGLRDTRIEWDLRLNSDVETDLTVEVASGKIDLDLSSVNLTVLDVRATSGAVRARFGGDYPDLEEVTVGMRSGDSVLDLGGRFDRLEQVEVEQTSGTIDLALRGEYPALESVEIESTSGIIDLDLRGQWPEGDVDVRVSATSGTVAIQVPDDIGVSLETSVKSGMVSAAGFSSADGQRTNAAFGRSATTIWLSVEVTSGMVRIT